MSQDSFIKTISTGSLQVHYYSEALSTQHGYCAGISRRSATSNCEVRTCPRSLYTWRPERKSNPWSFRRKASTLPMRHTPKFCPYGVWLCSTGWPHHWDLSRGECRGVQYA